MAKKKGIGDPVHVYNSEGLSYSPKGNVKASAKRVTAEKAAHGAKAVPRVDTRTGRTKSAGGRSDEAGSQPTKTVTGKTGETNPRNKARMSKTPGATKRKTGSRTTYKSRSSR
tara:strand:+ start:78 stop:416 length:339 start_codon:yes stop_codon:yes gene_type:complete